ncbi:MAG: hypothetical protein H0U70_11000 [Tatlockia sp.]|nr:hypothetical protein [Tatlockia sp.]
MFAVEFDGELIKNITIIGRIVKLSMSTDDGNNFVKEYPLATIRPEGSSVEIEILLPTLHNQENLELCLATIPNEYLGQELKQEFLGWYKDRDTPSITTIINYIHEYSYFFNHKLVQEEIPLLKEVMPIYIDFINQAVHLRSSFIYPPTIQVNNTTLDTTRVLETLLSSTMHLVNLKRIEKALENYENNLIDKNRLIGKLQRLLVNACETPFPNFGKLLPSLGSELAENTFFSGDNLNDLYAKITEQFNTLFETNLKFQSQTFPHPNSCEHIVVDLEKGEFTTPLKQTKYADKPKKINYLMESYQKEQVSSSPRGTPKLSSAKTRARIENSENKIDVDSSPQKFTSKSFQAHVSKLNVAKTQTTTNPGANPFSLFPAQGTAHQSQNPPVKLSSNKKAEKDWELSACEMLACFISVIGWAVLIAYAIYHSPCYSEDEDDSLDDDDCSTCSF